MADLNKFADLGNVIITANKTLAPADQGIVQDVAVDSVITLPSAAATPAGTTFIVRNRGRIGAALPAGAVANKTAQITVAPNAADGVVGNGITPAVNKGVINTKATNQVGDYVKLVNTGVAGATAWQLEEVAGIWARVA